MACALIEYTPETESAETDEAEAARVSVFSEADEMELTAEFLEAIGNAELDRFLGNLIRRASRAGGNFVSSPTGQALGSALKSAASRVLPVAGQAIGGYLGQRGAQFGSQAASAAGRVFGLELEGLSPEDKEFEVARNFVRFASEAIRNASGASATAAPRAAVQSAVIGAARRFAPGLLRNPLPVQLAVNRGSHASGRWSRRGPHIVIFNS